MAIATGRKPMLLESSDVARLLGISYSGLYAIVKSGRLEPAFVTPRGLRLFAPEVVESFRAARAAAKLALARS